MKEIKPLQELTSTYQKALKIFLAGSIENGKAEAWQKEVVKILSPVENMVVFNPRRDDWDPSWKSVASNPEFSAQVNWELDNLAEADLILMYFDPNTASPISLLELGLHAFSGTRMVVCCPDGYFRQGNVEIVCKRAGIPFMRSKEEFFEFVRSLV